LQQFVEAGLAEVKAIIYLLTIGFFASQD